MDALSNTIPNNSLSKIIPMDAVNIILEYAGYHNNRNGKFISIIDKDDTRYTILSTLSLPIIVVNENRRHFIMLKKKHNKTEWYILSKYIFSDFIEYSITKKIFPLPLKNKGQNKIKKYGYGCSNGYGDIQTLNSSKIIIA